MAVKRKIREAKPIERTEFQHERYRIVAGEWQGHFQAIAYLRKRKIDMEASQISLETALAILQQRLDQRLENYKNMRAEGHPSFEEFSEALEALEKDETELLKAHTQIPNAAATFTELGKLCGFDPQYIDTSYRRIGRKVSNMLNFSPKISTLTPATSPIASIALPEGQSLAGDINWRLRTEVISTLMRTG